VYGLFSKIVSPLTNSWLFSPVKNQVDVAASRGERVIDRLIMKGRIEEQNSRLLMRQENINDLMNEFVDYLVLKTEIRQIIQEASVNVAGDVVGDFQEQSAAVDTAMEQKLKSIFRKRPSEQPVTPPSHPAEGE
jgi:polyhydroxyalkanoate synthesis regulator phasin